MLPNPCLIEPCHLPSPALLRSASQRVVCHDNRTRLETRTRTMPPLLSVILLSPPTHLPRPALLHSAPQRACHDNRTGECPVGPAVILLLFSPSLPNSSMGRGARNGGARGRGARRHGRRHHGRWHVWRHGRRPHGRRWHGRRHGRRHGQQPHGPHCIDNRTVVGWRISVPYLRREEG